MQNIPKTIADYYERSDHGIHVAKRKGASTIVVCTTERVREVWKKHGKLWMIESTTPIITKREKRQQADKPTHLFGQSIHVADNQD